MKKKILALCLVVVLAVTAVTGATLAYFTDVDQNTNEFTVGNVKIDLYEDVKHEDGAGNKKMEEKKDQGKGDDTNPGIKYVDIQPGDKMTKIAHVENTGKNDAYVALVIKQENYLHYNNNVDEYYEKAPFNYDAKKMQEVTDDVFLNWNLLYDKNQITENAKVRYTIDTLPAAGEGVEVLGVGYAQENVSMTGNPQYHYSGEYFKNIVGGTEVPEGEPDFFTISADGKHDRVWIVYLKLKPEAVFTMDLTTVCPAYFDNNSTVAFDNMVLDIKAFAIQTNGFKTVAAAFAEALKPGFGF